MLSLKKLSLIFTTALSLSAASLYGNTFDYSYTFNNGRVVTGSFDGTQNGNLITDITNGTLYFNSTFVANLSYAVAAFGNAPLTVSIDGSQNNFVFDFDNGDPLGDTFAWFQSGDLGQADPQFAGVTFFGSNINDLGLSGFTQDNVSTYPVAKWLVTTRSVPDASATIFMFGMGIAGIVSLRRKLVG